MAYLKYVDNLNNKIKETNLLSGGLPSPTLDKKNTGSMLANRRFEDGRWIRDCRQVDDKGF